MYCIECGAQIPDNSKFCSHCGKPQSRAEPTLKEMVADKIIENDIIRHVVEEEKNSLNSQILRESIGWYSAWVIVHLGCLLIGSDAIFTDGYKTDGFWPFGDGSISEYDIREFLVYTLFPLAILYAWSMFRSNKRSDPDT